MKIWIDLANSPQVLFFRPILNVLREKGHTVTVTTRAYAQTDQLAGQFKMQHMLIGAQGGRGLWGLMHKISLRVWQLARWARPQHFDLAVSHNSYSQAVASYILGIPFITLMDYEHQPLNHLCFRLARKVIVPEVFSEDAIKRFGVAHKTQTYPGIKEQVYLADFMPQENFRIANGLPDSPLIVVRPPAPWTAYHRFQNDLFDDLLVDLSRRDGYILFLPRIKEQIESIRHLKNIHVAEKVYDGPNLLHHADCVISGGGTMNREAAVLGTPVFTIFKGKMGCVDQFLIQKLLMTQLISPDDFTKITFQKKQNNLSKLKQEPELVVNVTDMILDPQFPRR